MSDLEGRLSTGPSEMLLRAFEAPHFARELRQISEYLAVDRAHVVMLVEEKILSRDKGAQILSALAELSRMAPEQLPMAKGGGILATVEGFLSAKFGPEVSGWLQTGRSRIDQMTAVRRLYKRRRMLSVVDRLIDFQNALLVRASQHTATVMPGYTCLQHAHPWVFGHYLLSFVDRFADDFDRLCEAWPRVNRNPLGAAGLAGTSWPVNRQRTSTLLGFDGLVENSRSAREAYYAAEIISGLSFVMADLNDMATDFHIWSSHEFRLVETADAHCGTSSIFPQKKNPVALEAVKFAAGGAVNWLSTALATFRSEGSGDVSMRELPLVDEAFNVTADTLELFTEVMATMTVHAVRMRELAGENWSTATDIADLLVRRHDLSFRQAHHVTARLVRSAIANGLRPQDCTGELLVQAAEEIIGKRIQITTEEVIHALDPTCFVATRVTKGSVAPTEVARLLGEAQQRLAVHRDWLVARRRDECVATQKLQLAERAIIGSGLPY